MKRQPALDRHKKKPASVCKPAKEPAPAPAPIEDESKWTNRRATDQAIRAAQARQSSGRRRLVDPATCDRDYTPAELEFMQAMQNYKASSGRMFPTWSEVLEVLRALGYEKTSPPAESALGRAGNSDDRPRRIASAG